jgi:hypothetical protein
MLHHARLRLDPRPSLIRLTHGPSCLGRQRELAAWMNFNPPVSILFPVRPIKRTDGDGYAYFRFCHHFMGYAFNSCLASRQSRYTVCAMSNPITGTGFSIGLDCIA